MNYHQYKTPEIVAAKLAEFIKEALDAHAATTFHLALSLKESLPTIAAALSSVPRADADWGRVHFYLLHETLGVPEQDTHRHRLQKHLFDPLRIPEGHIHGVSAGADAQEAIRRLTDEVAGAVPHLSGYPQFDLAILEMGTDGHVAGVYPDQLELYMSEQPFALNRRTTGEGREEQTVTVTLSAIEEAKSIALVALGQDVRHAVGHIVNLFPQAKSYPANYLASKVPWVHLFADDQAMREKSYAIY